MTKYSLDNIDPDLLSQIASTVAQVVNYEYPEALQAVDTETNNHQHFLLWDILNTPLLRNFSSTKILASKKKRGLWELVLLFDTDSKTIFSFMKEYRIKQLRNRDNRDKAHYLDALVRLNANIQIKSKQMNLFGDVNDPEVEKQCEVILSNLCSDFKNNNDVIKANHVVIGFSNKEKILTSIKAYVLDKNLNIIECKPLEEYINLGFPISDIETEENSTHQVTLPLTQKAKKVRTRNKNIEENKIEK